MIHRFFNNKILSSKSCKQFLAGRSTSKDELEEMLVSGNPAIFTQGIITDTQQALQSLQEIQARHRDIIKLEKNILELHDLFLEMAQLIEHQGEMIDVIQHQVEQTKDFVLQGNEQIVEALKNKASATRVRFLYFIYFKFYFFKSILFLLQKKLLCYSILAVILILLFFALFSDILKWWNFFGLQNYLIYQNKVIKRISSRFFPTDCRANGAPVHFASLLMNYLLTARIGYLSLVLSILNTHLCKFNLSLFHLFWFFAHVYPHTHVYQVWLTFFL